MSDVKIGLGNFPNPEGACVVCLRKGDDRTPLFLAVPGYGNMRAFHKVVEHLEDKDRAVYGIWPPASGQIAELRKKPMAHIVSLYLRDIKRVQPVGPYNLIGYSLAGMFLLEVARELMRGDDEIGMLVLLDSFVKAPWIITSWYISSYRICNLTPGISKFRWWMIRKRRSKIFAFLTDEGQCTSVFLSRKHTPEPFPGWIICVVPKKSWIWWSNLLSMQMWAGMTSEKISEQGVEIYRMPGNHSGMLTHAGGRTIAGLLDRLLRKNGS